MKKGWMAAAALIGACAVMAGCKGAGRGIGAGQETESAAEMTGQAQKPVTGTADGELDRALAEKTDWGADKSPGEEGPEGESVGENVSEREVSRRQGEYIFPESSARLLSEAEVAGVSPERLRLARNEIFARHGRRFSSDELQGYFDAKDWYEGRVDPEDFSDSVLSEIEKENIKLTG